MGVAGGSTGRELASTERHQQACGVVDAAEPRGERRSDPLVTFPFVPADWRILRGLLQLLSALVILFVPTTLLSPPITRSTLGVYVAPVVLIGVGWVVRRRLSRRAGTLLIFGMSIHLALWIATYFYARWLFRDL